MYTEDSIERYMCVLCVYEYKITKKGSFYISKGVTYINAFNIIYKDKK
jgi:hypothetical protein